MPIVSRGLTTLASLALVLWLLYWLQPVLVPVALAGLVTFLLSPPAGALERRRVPRPIAVALVVTVSLAAVGGVAWLVTRQITGLVEMLPRYEASLVGRIAALQGNGTGVLDRLQETVRNINHELEAREKRRTEAVSGAPAASRPAPAAEEPEPLPVRVIAPADPFRLSALWSVLGPAVSPFAAAGLSLVLVIFMLLRREDIRDRLITLVGRRQLSLTTRALEEASERISRYLLMQLGVNAGFGVATGIGLFLLGIPYAPLWGFLAAVLRYIPYLGAWLAALLPIGLSLLVTEGWMTPLAVLAMFLAIEFVTNMLLEPWLYGRGIGVSQPATLVMIAFWTWLWGPVGLVLATPLTVCLVVMGKYVPALKNLDTALSDRPVLAPPFAFYQRLLARDADEALAIAESHAATEGVLDTLDAVLLRALVLLQNDADHGEVDAEDEAKALEVADGIVARLDDNDPDAAETAPAEKVAEALAPSDGARIPVLAVAAQTGASEVALHMLQVVLDERIYTVEAVPGTMLASEVVQRVRSVERPVVIVTAVAPRGLAKARLLALRLQARAPDARLLVALLGRSPKDIEALRKEFDGSAPAGVVVSLAECAATMESLRALANPSPVVTTAPEEAPVPS